MSEKRYKVPEGMHVAAIDAMMRVWEDANDAYRASLMGRAFEDQYIGMCMRIVEAVLRYQAENPVVPTVDQYRSMWNDADPGPVCLALIVEWQRRAYLVVEPEIPEAVKDLLAPRGVHTNFTVPNDKHDEQISEAYRRGKQGK